MLLSSMLIPSRLLFLMFILDNGQAVQPQGCTCYNPKVLNNTDNSTVPCNSIHCSRGDNVNCFAYRDPLVSKDIPIFTIRAFAFHFEADNDPNEYFSFLGCNCPGFNYAQDHDGMNGYSNYPPSVKYGDPYIYKNCKDFTLGLDDVEYCCNYCCGPVYVSTTITPSASISQYSFNFWIFHVLFPLILLCFRMITLNPIELMLHAHAFNHV